MDKKVILMVDDDEDVLTPSQAILESAGYEVVISFDKDEALEKLKKVIPNLIISDVMMRTHYEGFEFAKEITTNPDLKNVPIIIQSGIEVLTTTNPSLQQMVHEVRKSEDVQRVANEYRNDPNYREMKVLLIKDNNTGLAGVDYLNENGNNVWLNVNDFLAKPVEAKKLLETVERNIK